MQTFFVFSSDYFDILNECAYYEQVYKDLGIGIDERLFAINGPFLMDSQFEAMKEEMRRVRKRKKPDCSAVKYSNEFTGIERIAKAVREAGHRVGFFSNQTNRDNNRVARDAVRELLKNRIEMHKPQAIVTNEITIIGDNSYVMDDSILFQIEMDSLAPSGLVAVWITNREGIERDLAVHFRRWGLERIATFYWLKVTQDGGPVCSFSEFHKVPYERFVLASRPQSVSRYTSVSAVDGKVFASVPMALPSRKPPVVPILRSLGVQPKWCLELFARSLLPNTVSVGFEPLLLQSSSCLVNHEAKVS
ncbi:hypothetical protein Angca_004502 [Angiostrongylus cantonensis]|nr:hypothetical protein Angca_004502 [Angiostrongylus cantonensis]